MPDEKRVIKKYPNRRLYDTVESKYITLDDVRRLVLDGVSFCVIDKKTGEDITRNILLQIIIEQEDAGEPIFSTDVLQQIIGFYGDSMQNLASRYIEKTLSLFREQQELVQSRFSSAVEGTPMEALADLTQKNIDMWNRMQRDFLNAAGLAGTARRREQDEED
jgi:polyhydroxyalkanoate synthesis repressor PhaR